MGGSRSCKEEDMERTAPRDVERADPDFEKSKNRVTGAFGIKTWRLPAFFHGFGPLSGEGECSVEGDDVRRSINRAFRLDDRVRDCCGHAATAWMFRVCVAQSVTRSPLRTDRSITNCDSLK